MYLYLDESGDLGFDFENKRPSKFFVITLLRIDDTNFIKSIHKAVRNTLQKKINYKKKGRVINELKGSDTTLSSKQYFLTCLHKKAVTFKLYSIVLDKQKLLTKIKNPIKENVYTQMTHQLLEKVVFPPIQYVHLVVDRCQNKQGIKKFNNYLETNFSLCLKLETKLHITHHSSEKEGGIQAADMFCHGISEKYEQQNEDWYKLYKEKILVECKFQI